MWETSVPVPASRQTRSFDPVQKRRFSTSDTAPQRSKLTMTMDNSQLLRWFIQPQGATLLLSDALLSSVLRVSDPGDTKG
ncbi:unnamed protein product [Peronospora belbahrii]|uniref:Uncharacterized protein n=1 Tax=Peronospora belbahrii TaxID=622444 RepID=A0ABN8D513_9STRA|nr:unnamed protein product [Peronospora belbahrii]